jgi:hypothetical protein
LSLVRGLLGCKVYRQHKSRNDSESLLYWKGVLDG